MVNKKLLSAMNMQPNELHFEKNKTLAGVKNLNAACADASLSTTDEASELQDKLKADFSQAHANTDNPSGEAYDSKNKRYKY